MISRIFFIWFSPFLACQSASFSRAIPKTWQLQTQTYTVTIIIPYRGRKIHSSVDIFVIVHAWHKQEPILPIVRISTRQNPRLSLDCTAFSLQKPPARVQKEIGAVFGYGLNTSWAGILGRNSELPGFNERPGSWKYHLIFYASPITLVAKFTEAIASLQ